MTLIHELAHWISDQLPITRSRSISNHERWSDRRGHTSGGCTTVYNSRFEATDNEVHEGWAQLITFYSLLMVYNDRLRNSVARPSLLSYVKSDGRGCLYAFLELNKHQSSKYQVWRDILSLDKTPQQVIGTLTELRNASPGATMSGWKSMLAAL